MYLHLGQDALVKTNNVILPKTFVVCGKGKGGAWVYLSQISSSTLRKRTGFVEAISSPGHRSAASGTGRK